MANVPPLHPVIAQVTARVRERSAATRADYLERMAAAQRGGTARAQLACANLAHAIAAEQPADSMSL